MELSGTVMTWPKSSRGYNESTAVMYGDSQDQFSCLFNLCVLPVLHILQDDRDAYHSYINDSQIYLILSPDDYRRSVCALRKLNNWMQESFLQLKNQLNPYFWQQRKEGWD